MVVLVGIGSAAAATTTVTGQIIDSDGPVSGATIRQRATVHHTTSDADGFFTLAVPSSASEIEVTAWAYGYYIATTHVIPPAENVILQLRPYHTVDHPDYTWTSPISGTSPGACGNCHPLILPQWTGNAHGRAVENQRFFSLYNGTDVNGDNEVTPGYRQDFPGTTGNCANCHAPGAAVDGYLSTDMNSARGDITAGIHCDYCHKVGGVYMDPATQSVYPNAPGVRSQRVLRPPPGDDIFFGPYDDIHDPDTHLPEISESRFCAGCHQFSFWGTPIYESYNEWLATPYADVGVTCQTCHMPPTGDTFFALPEVGGLAHPPETIPSHLQLGATSETLLKRTVDMTVDAEVTTAGNSVQATVTITNSGAGHHIPTDFPGRHLILSVQAVDGDGRPLTLIDGPVIPDWGGDLAGQAGRAYAKVLMDLASGETPVISYWKQTVIVEDNRIPALGSDTARFRFSSCNDCEHVEITATLVLRRTFQDLATARGWAIPDMLLAEVTNDGANIPTLNFPLYLPIVY